MRWILIIVFLWSSINVFGQKGYAKDSLQFKAYVHFKYVNGEPYEIKIKKIFCNYCNEIQLKFLKEKFYEQAFEARYAPDVRIKKGLKKQTFIRRFAKEDFKNMNNH